MTNSKLPPEWCGTIETDFVRYEYTETRFIKTTRLPSQYRKLHNGGVELIARPWASERIWNEVAALKLISERTTIPVPKLISYGAKEDGTAYLETERVYGIELSRIGEQCWMGNRYSHSKGGPCHECEQIAKENAQQFIREVVLPQLATLQSNTTGLNGFVIPPAWMLEYARRQHWPPKTSQSSEYHFVHGDLSPGNLMICPRTLEVTCVYDWEHSGYFPSQFQQWSVDKKGYYDLFEKNDMLDELIALIEP